MTNRPVFYIKLIHSLLFLLISICTIYVLIAALIDVISMLTWVAFGIIVVELFVLIINDWRCPFTDWAEQRGAKIGSVADLFLPRWFSDYLFTIFGILFSIICLLLIWRIIY